MEPVAIQGGTVEATINYPLLCFTIFIIVVLILWIVYLCGGFDWLIKRVRKGEL